MADPLETESAEALLSFKNGGFKVKRELDFGDDSDHSSQPMTLGPEMFGLKRISEVNSPIAKGTTSSSSNPITLNRRGIPARIRKKNPLFFDDETIVNQSTNKSPRKSTKVHSLPEKQKSETGNIVRRVRSAVAAAVPPTITASSVEQEAEDLKKLGVRLRNLLKLPKAHKWVCYEWFYSNLDQALFEGDNDFILCLRESFPSLKLRQLTRSQWCTIRRLMGRPRRCSQAFFNEERGELAKKRQKIRLVQQRKVSDMGSLCRDLPDLIPMPLVIGTKVTARLRQPQDGLFVGQIDAVDTSNNTYRITFDRQGLGTHSVPDYEVLSNETVDMISISSLAQRFRPRPAVLPPTPAIIPLMASQQQTQPTISQRQPPKNPANEISTSNFAITPIITSVSGGHASQSELTSLVSDPVLGSSHTRLMPQETSFGSLPMHVITPIVRLSKVLNLKKDKIRRLREMNTEVERRESIGETVAPDFQRRYARAILDLEELNTELNSLLVKVRLHCQEISPDSEHGLSPLAGPDSIRQLCYQEARDLVETQLDSRTGTHHNVTSTPIIALVTGLTSLMLQIKCLAESERNAYELQALHDSLDELRNSLDKSNLTSLRNHVLVHVQHIQSGLCNFDHMTPFNGTDTNAPTVTSTNRNLPLPNYNDNH
nr:EOG090X03EV [Megafenestra aurita]